MSAVRQIGIKMVVDAQSVTTEVPKAAREFDNLGARAEQAAARTTRSLANVQMSVRDIVAGAAGLHVVSSAIQGITSAITALPRNAFDYSKNLEVSQVGMAGILGSMTAINGLQTDYNQALRLSSEYIRKLNDDALRTAATSQELTTVFQALLAPGLSAKMTLEEIRQLTVVGTNAVKSMGLESTQVVQELRDLVAGGITPASSTLATALGLKDSDIQKARASSEGLFNFLMGRLKGFEASSEAFGDTLKGKLDQVKEGATRVAAEGLEPLISASKAALGHVSSLFVTIGEGGQVTLNTELVDSIKEYATTAAQAMAVGQQWVGVMWENRDAALALGAVWASIKLGGMVADTAAAVAAKAELAQASRLAAVQAAAEAAGNVEVVATSRQKVAAYLAELEAKVAAARADAAAHAAQVVTLTTTREAIVVARAEVVAKLDATRATMAQAEAQIAAARAAGAQSMALAMLREGTVALTAAQARHALLMTELATLGKQQAGVNAAIATSTAAQTAATNAATAAASGLAAAQGAASIAGRALSGAVGFLGGPIGIVTTALTLGATAWAIWGNSGNEAERKVQGAVERSTPEIVADLDKQIAKLQARNALVAAGLGDIAKKAGEDAERAARLQVQINNLQSGKGVDGGAPLPEAARAGVLQTLLAQYGELVGKIRSADQEQSTLDRGTQQLTLTSTGALQAFEKTLEGAKTASAAQQEYTQKVEASRMALEAFKATKPEAAALVDAQKKFDESEKAWAAERDKKIKEMGAGTASALSHGIDAQIAAAKQGYKLLAAQTADGLDEIDSLRRQDLLSESEAQERRTALQLQDMDAQRGALQAELELLKGKKDSAKEHANIVGELAELAQKRTNLQNKADRDQRESDAQQLVAMEARIEAAQAAARQGQESVRVAQLETLEIGQTGAALGALRQARVEETAKQLEAQARTQDGIDLSGRMGDALRAQAQAVRDLAKVSGFNEAAKMVSDYAKGIDEANAATQYELSLSSLSQRDRDIAMEQYRVAIDLKQRLADIDAKNPADAEGAAKLKAQASAAAARAQAGAAARVNMAEWKQSVQQYDDIFRKGFADMVNHGKDGWKSFTKSLATTFKTTVADQLYKAFAQPFVVNVVGNLLGLSGAGGAAGAVSAGSNLLGMASNASSLYSAFTGNGLIGNTIRTVGGWLGLGGGAATGLGLSAATGAGVIGSGIGAGLGLGSAAAGAGTGLGLSLGGTGLGLSAGSAGAGAIGAGLGTSAAAGGAGAAAGAGAGGISGALAAVPGWGWALAGVAAIAAIFGKKSTPHMGAGSEYSAATGLQSNRDVYASLGFTGKQTWSDDVQKSITAPLAQSIGQTLDGFAKAFGSAAGFEVATAFADDKSKDGAWGALRIRQGGKDVLDWGNPDDKWAGVTFANGEDGIKEYMAKVAADVRDVLKTSAPGWVDTMLDSLGDAPSMDNLSAVVQQIGQLQAVFESFGQYMPTFASLADSAVDKLVQASGGAGTLAANMASFVDGFYSDAEKLAINTANVRAAMAELGFEMPQTRDEFRALVQAQMALGDAGMQTTAGLLALSDDFKAVTQDIVSASETLKQQRESAFSALDRAVSAERDALRARLDAAQDIASTLSGVFDVLHSNVRELYGEVGDTRAMLAQQGGDFITAALATAKKSGYLPDQDQLAEAIGAVRAGLADGFDVDSAERDYATKVLAGQLSEMEKIAGKQLTDAQRTVKELETHTGQLDQTLEYWRRQISLAEGTQDATLSVAEAVGRLQDFLGSGGTGTGGTGTGTGKPSGGGGGGGAGGITAGSDYQRVGYGADEALGSFDKFSAWYQGLRSTANVGAMTDGGYKRPDWMRVAGMADDGTDKELFAQYQFFKNNPQYAADYQQIMTTGRSSYGTDGSTLVRSDLSKMPEDVAAYYKNNTAALLQAEGFLLDPVLAYQLYRDGPERFGLDRRKESFTEWLRSNQWSAEGVVAGNNAHKYAGMDYAHYNLTKWDTATGTLVGRDGIIYTPDGKPVGKASASQMQELYGNSNSRLYNQTTSGGTSAQDYYTGLRQKYDQDIADGKSAQYLADNIRNSGASMQDIATAYGISVDVLKENLRLGGATDIPQFAGGGYHAGGLRIVGEEGWEVEATGPSRIWNQRQLAQALTGGGSNAQLEALVQSLMAEIKLLRQSVDRGSDHAGDTAAALREVKNGNSLIVEMAPSALS